MTNISALIIKKLQQRISTEEQEELDRFSAQSAKDKELVERLTNYQSLLDDVKASYQWLSDDDLRQFESRLKKP